MAGFSLVWAFFAGGGVNGIQNLYPVRFQSPFLLLSCKKAVHFAPVLCFKKSCCGISKSKSRPAPILFCVLQIYTEDGIIGTMDRNSFIAKRIASLLQWFRVYGLYRRAFPQNERKPFSMILSMWRKGRTDVWYFEDGGRFAGFASTINSRDIILLDYLAVQEGRRGRGIGSRILQELKKAYAGRGIFVEIESAFESGAGQAERIRRKRFYIANGLQPSRVMADVFGVRMELLCWNCCVNFSAYHAFYRDHYNAWAAEHILEAEYPAAADVPASGAPGAFSAGRTGRK